MTTALANHEEHIAETRVFTLECSTNVCSSEDRFDRRIYDGYIDQENRRDNEASDEVNLFERYSKIL
jgi:hypothetical protein